MYPVCLDIKGKLCVVVGGGKVARRKVKGLVAAGAVVRVISPKVDKQLADLAREGKIEWRENAYAEGDLKNAFLVFAATDDRHIQELICRQAATNNQLVNVADDPGCCNFHVPSSFRRGDLTIAISTGGKSPAAAAMIREGLENSFGPEYAVLLDIMALVRQQLSATDNTQAERKKIYKKILHDDILNWIKTGQVETLHVHLEKVLGRRMMLDLSKVKMEI